MLQFNSVNRTKVLLLVVLVMMLLIGCSQAPANPITSVAPSTEKAESLLHVADPVKPVAVPPKPKEWPKDYDSLTRLTVHMASRALFIAECESDESCVQSAIACSNSIDPTKTDALKKTNECIQKAKERS